MLTVKKCMCPEEFLNMLNLSGLPQHMLKPNVNKVVILLHVMNIKTRHFNVTRYLIKSIGHYHLELVNLNCKLDDKN